MDLLSRYYPPGNVRNYEAQARIGMKLHLTQSYYYIYFYIDSLFSLKCIVSFY